MANASYCFPDNPTTKKLRQKGVKSASKESLTCEICKKELKSEAALIRHIRFCYASKELSMKCNKCGKSFKGKKRAEHLAKHVKVGKYWLRSTWMILLVFVQQRVMLKTEPNRKEIVLIILISSLRYLIGRGMILRKV